MVRNAFAIFMLIGLRTLLSFVALLFRVRHSFQTGAPYDNIGNIAPVYIILRTSCLSPKLILADFDRVWISLMHFPVVCSIYSLKFNLLSMIMPEYVVSSCCNILLLRYMLKFRVILGFLLVIINSLDFCSLKNILLSLAQFSTFFCLYVGIVFNFYLSFSFG